MAKDKNGVELQVGDHVVIHGVVLSMRRDDDAANLTIETVDVAPNTNQPHRMTLSAQQAEKVSEQKPARPAKKG
jgi:flavin reductase (DIM6/NTAB) family NADH-FMN oxidoreductase RutF